MVDLATKYTPSLNCSRYWTLISKVDNILLDWICMYRAMIAASSIRQKTDRCFENYGYRCNNTCSKLCWRSLSFNRFCTSEQMLEIERRVANMCFDCILRFRRFPSTFCSLDKSVLFARRNAKILFFHHLFNIYIHKGNSLAMCHID